MSTSKEQTLVFIKVDGSKEEHLRKAADYAKKYELDVNWISPKDVENYDDLDPNSSVFVLDPFEGEHFEFLKENKCRIVGPQCVISCIQTMTPLPFVDHPLYTVAMQGVNVCCTGIPKIEREELHELILLMGGNVVKIFTETVTHLVANEVGSQKYKAACNFNKPVLLPSWIYKCWESGKEKHICSTDEEFRSFACPMFKGFTVSVTGLESKERENVKRLVVENGGTYSGELNMNTCTHLIVDLPKGQKYEFARRWKLHCVSAQWLYDSVKSGYSLDEVAYYTLPEDGEQSYRASSHLSASRILNNTSFSTKSADQKRISKKATQAAYKSAQRLGDGALIAGTNGKKKQTLDSTKSSDFPTCDLEDQDYNVIVQPGIMFLDGCKIYLSNFNDFQMEKLRKIINCGGATRFNQVNETVSHIVVGNATRPDLNVLINSEFQPLVVTVKWILDSAKAGKRLPEDEYLCSQFNHSPSSSCKENKSPGTKHPKNSRQNARHSGKQAKTKNQDDGLDDEDVLQQYMSFSNAGDGLDAESNLTNFVTNGAAHKVDQEVPCEPVAAQSVDPDVTYDEVEPAKEGGLLAGKLLCTDGFSDDLIDGLVNLIEDHGGRLVYGAQQMSDFAILPMNKLPSAGIKAKQMVTFCWLEQSLEEEKLLEPTGNFLFQPFSIPEGCRPLVDCVLCISQYAGVERDHLFQLAELLGATCQEHLVRKATSRHQVTTHLLCQEPAGNKYAAAYKWNIPVVSDQWLFACAVTGRNEATKDYPVGKDSAEKPEKAHIESLEKSIMAEGKAGEDNSGARVEEKSEDENVFVEIPTEDQDCAETSHEPSRQGQADDEVDKPMEAPPGFFSKSFKPSFDTADALAFLVSPAVTPGLRRSRKSRGSRNSFALDDLFVQNIQKAIKNTEKSSGVQLPVTERKDASSEDESVQSKGILDGTIVAVSKKLNHQQTELYTLASSLGADYRWLYDDSCTHLIHQGHINDKTKEFTQARDRGAHVVSPHWLYACQEEGKRVDESLYVHTYNPNRSLSVVTSGRRLTRSSKAKVGQESSSKQPNKTQRTEKNNQEEEKVADEPSITAGEQTTALTTDIEDHQENVETAVPGLNRLESLEAQDNFKKHLEAIMVATKGKGRRRSRRQTSTSVDNAAQGSPGLPGGDEDVAGSRRTSARIKSRAPATRSNGQSTSGRGSRNRTRLTYESEHSQSDTITYDDPAGRLEREKIMALLNKGCSPSPDFEDYSPGVDKGNGQKLVEDLTNDDTTVSYTSMKPINATADKPEPPGSPSSSSTPIPAPVALPVREAFKPAPVNLLEDCPPKPSQTRARTPPKCHLSVMTPQEKIDYSAVIEKLGGTVFDTAHFNPACSHVIIGKPNRNEKYLAAVAAGKWVVRKSYVEASREAGHFVDEKPHECGEQIIGEPLSKLAAAARRWRLKLLKEKEASEESGEAAGSVGAFRGWKVLLCVDKSRQPGFKRLLEAGGAKVTGARSPISNTSGVTHVFLDPTKGKMNVSDIEKLQSAGIHPLKPEYIADYLMEDPPPHPRKYLVSHPTAGEDVDAAQRKKRKAREQAGDEKRARVN